MANNARAPLAQFAVLIGVEALLGIHGIFGTMNFKNVQVHISYYKQLGCFLIS